MAETTYDYLYRNCRSIVDTLEAEEPDHAATLIDDALDIQFIVSTNGGYMGAKILVAFGGPNIWVDTRFDEVTGSWGTDSIILRFTDTHDIHAHCEGLYQSMMGII